MDLTVKCHWIQVLKVFHFDCKKEENFDPINLLFHSVERYDPRQNKWTLVAPMSTRRKHLGCAVYNNWIYAVGGRDDATELSSAERYNPNTNTWSPIVAMSSRRSGVSSLVWFFKFDSFEMNFVFLGWSRRCERAIVCRRRIRRFDILEDDWSIRSGAESVAFVRNHELPAARWWRRRCKNASARDSFVVRPQVIAVVVGFALRHVID